MGSNIIAHLIFFSLYTSYSLILNIPTTTHFEIYSNHCHMFGSSFNNTKFDLMYLKLHQCCWSVLTHWSQVWPYVSQVSTILFTFSHFTFCFSYLFLQNSLSLNEHVQEAGAAKKKAPTEASDHYKSAYLRASLVLPQHKYRKSDFFSLEQKVSKENLMFWGQCGCLRLHHFILERAFSKSKPFFLNLKQDLSF